MVKRCGGAKGQPGLCWAAAGKGLAGRRAVRRKAIGEGLGGASGASVLGWRAGRWAVMRGLAGGRRNAGGRGAPGCQAGVKLLTC